MSCRSTEYGMRDHGKACVEGSTRCRYRVGERGSELGSGAQPVSNARQILAMLRCRAAGDDEQFFTIALQVAAAEARQGHRTLAEGIRDAVEKARTHSGFGQTVTVPFAAPRGDLADLFGTAQPLASARRRRAERPTARPDRRSHQGADTQGSASRAWKDPESADPLRRPAGIRQDDDRRSARRSPEASLVRDSPGGADHTVHGRDGGEASPRIRRDGENDAACICSTNSTRSAGIAAHPTMLQRCAESSTPFCSSWKNRTPRTA